MNRTITDPVPWPPPRPPAHHRPRPVRKVGLMAPGNGSGTDERNFDLPRKMLLLN